MFTLNPLTKEYWTHPSGCPRLFLAPMEGLGDGLFRRAYRFVGGFDEACTEFMRVPKNAHVKSLARKYSPLETSPYPQAAQIMGDDPELLGAMAQELEGLGAPRIDLNCGCPSNTVVGRGAGSSLLREPGRLHQITRAIVDSVSVPVTAKLRSGYEDTSLFQENLLAAQEAGIAFLTLHPRTKKQGYQLPVYWQLIAQAKEVLSIPVVGSGEVWTPDDAWRMKKETACDGIMVGRGAIADPWIFHRIKAHWSGGESPESWEKTEAYLWAFYQEVSGELVPKGQVNKLKQMVRYLFRAEHEEVGKRLLRQQGVAPKEFFDFVLEELRIQRFPTLV